MLSPHSPFRNIPFNIDRRQAFFLDGMRHAIEIADLSFKRLRNELEYISILSREKRLPNDTFAKFFLDAWAFVDSLYRFIGLWKLQPASSSLPIQYSTSKIAEKFKSIADIRNVSDHLAQKSDQVLASKTASLGVLTWIAFLEDQPLTVGTFLIAPGVIAPTIKETLETSVGKRDAFSRVINIQLRAGQHKANLSEAYYFLKEIVSFAEKSLSENISKHDHLPSCGADVFISALLDVRDE